MESERIEKLLEKYWGGETTLEEETKIKQFFQGQDIPLHLERLKPLFRYYNHQSMQELDEAFEAKLEGRLTRGHIHNDSFPWKFVVKVAASVLIVGLSVYYFYFNSLNPRQPQSNATVVTFEDPELAYRQTKATLLLISEKLNTGQKYTAEFKKLGEADALFKDYTNESLNP